MFPGGPSKLADVEAFVALISKPMVKIHDLACNSGDISQRKGLKLDFEKCGGACATAVAQAN